MAAGGPLAGIRVIDLTTTVLGPLTTQQLGDLGADVIKVESPEGDPMRYLGPASQPGMGAMYVTNNRNKRGLVLDLKRPEPREAFDRLIRSADVLVHNMRAKAMARLKLAYADVVAVNPRIIYGSAGGYSADGPLADLPAFDDVIQGASGIPALFLNSGREAQFAPFSCADKVSAYVLASSIGMALFHRERTGEGQEVHVPMLETMISFNLHEHLWGAAFDPPIGSIGYSRMRTLHRRPFETRDGYVCVMPVTDAQWNRLLLALDRPDLAADERFARMEQRGANFDALYGAVGEEMRKHDTAAIMARLGSVDVPCGPSPRLEDLQDDEYLKTVGFFQHYTHPTAGPMVTTKVPVHYSRSPGAIRLPPPTLGEHSREILAELGYAEAEIDVITAKK